MYGDLITDSELIDLGLGESLVVAIAIIGTNLWVKE
jgi:hypothetical protein